MRSGYRASRWCRLSERGKTGLESLAKGDATGSYDEDHSSPRTAHASNAEQRVGVWLTGPQNQGVALPAGPTQRSNAVPGPTTRQFQGRMQRDPRS